MGSCLTGKCGSGAGCGVAHNINGILHSQREAAEGANVLASFCSVINGSGSIQSLQQHPERCIARAPAALGFGSLALVLHDEAWCQVQLLAAF